MSATGGPAFRKLLRLYDPLPVTSGVTSARYDWLFWKPQQLSLAKPMLVPVTGVPANDTAAFAVGSVEFVGPFQ